MTEIRAADQIEPERLHAAFSEAFSDYIAGPFMTTLAQWPALLARQAVDLALSRVALQAGQVLAFAFVAPRGDAPRWRLAAMGALPAARGSGAAPLLLDDFIARAGGLATELEVFAQNERAVRLYRGRGFEPLHELHGYTRAAARSDGVAAPFQKRSRDEAFGWLAETMRALPDLPLQVTPQVLVTLTQPLQVWACGGAQLVFTQQDATSAVVVHSLIDRAREQADAERLLTALLARHGARDIRVPALQRADVGGDALLRLGFQRQPLHQLLLRRGAG